MSSNQQTSIKLLQIWIEVDAPAEWEAEKKAAVQAYLEEKARHIKNWAQSQLAATIDEFPGLSLYME